MKSTGKKPVPAADPYEIEAEKILAELDREKPDNEDEWTISTGALRHLLERKRAS